MTMRSQVPPASTAQETVEDSQDQSTNKVMDIPEEVQECLVGEIDGGSCSSRDGGGDRGRVHSRNMEHIVDLAVRRILEELVQVSKAILQDRVPQVMPRQVPAAQTVQRTTKVPQAQFIDRAMGSSSRTTEADTPESPERGCRHAFCGATQGAHGSRRADDTTRRRSSSSMRWW